MLQEYKGDPEKVRALMTKKKVTVKELAKGAGIGESAIRHWFCGMGTPGFNSLIKLSRFFDVSIEELLQEATE